MNHVKDVNEQDFQTEVIERSKTVPVVVDFWATWCEPCKTLGPMLERAAEQYDGAFELVKIDVDANQNLSQQLQIQSIPTVAAFVDGQPVPGFQGAIPEAQLHEWLSGFVAPLTNPDVELALMMLDQGDEAGAEAKLREILSTDFDADAAQALAVLYIDQEKFAEANEVLDLLPASPEVDQLRSIANMAAVGEQADEIGAKLAEDPTNRLLQIEYAKAVAGRGEYAVALDGLMIMIEDKIEEVDEARAAVIEIFGVLGPDSEITQTYRRRLANALY